MPVSRTKPRAASRVFIRISQYGAYPAKRRNSTAVIRGGQPAPGAAVRRPTTGRESMAFSNRASASQSVARAHSSEQCARSTRRRRPTRRSPTERRPTAPTAPSERRETEAQKLGGVTSRTKSETEQKGHDEYLLLIYENESRARGEGLRHDRGSEEVRMARYVDGYVLPVPKKNIDAYRRMAQKG